MFTLMALLSIAMAIGGICNAITIYLLVRRITRLEKLAGLTMEEA